MAYDIFISYRRDSGAQYARIMQLMLQQRGYKVFLDYDELTDGVFGDHIKTAIIEAPVFMLILSENSLDRCVNEDDWVRQEILLAIKEEKPVIPVNPDNKFNGLPKDCGDVIIPDEIKNYIISNQHSEIGFGQTLGVTIELMIEKRIVPRLGRRTPLLNVDNDFEAAKKTLKMPDSKNLPRILHKAYFRLKMILTVAFIIMMVGIFYINIKNNPRFSVWLERIQLGKYQRIDLKDISLGEIHGVYEAVDLGLSVKWATCNIGADYPFDDGDFFSWGEVQPKTDYSWTSYKFAAGDSVTKYCLHEQYGKVDTLSILCDSDDAAKAIWGHGWRMPTFKETEELISNCTFHIKRLYGQLGFVVIGPNGNSIFLPMSGDICDSERAGYNKYAIFWTSNLSKNTMEAYEFAISHLHNYWYLGQRNTGHNIRPVHE